MTGSRIRVLAAAFAAVPGSSPHSAAMLSMVDALRGELDLVTVKTEDLSHIKRIGEARMFRVPMGAATPRQQRDLYARAVGRQLEAEPYQVVHVFDAWAGAEAAERHRGFSLVYEITTFPEPEHEADWLEAHERTLAAADLVLVPTAAAAAALEGRGVTVRVEVLRPGVDVGDLDWAEVPSFGTPRILYLGPFSPIRDLDTVLAAIARVAALRPVRVLLAGERDRERRAALREKVKAAGLGEIVDVRGEPAERSAVNLIAAADVCLAPGCDQRIAGLTPLPQPLLEHLACLRPVVAADVPGVSELIRDEIEGLLHPPSDAGALADAVLEVLRDASLRERLMVNGYRRARDDLSSGARRRRVQEIYEALAPGSQLVDPWREEFEEVTGVPDLPSAPSESSASTAPEGVVDTAETLAPASAPGEKTRPRAEAPGEPNGDLGDAQDGAPPRGTKRRLGRRIDRAKQPATEEIEAPADGPATAETDTASEPARGAPRAREAPHESTDTSPGLALPDTDPGER